MFVEVSPGRTDDEGEEAWQGAQASRIAAAGEIGVDYDWRK